MLVIRQKRIYREDLQANRRILYVFGDNLQRQGFGGQAAEMRGEPNAFGFATKRAITHGNDSDYFFDHQADVKRILREEMDNLQSALCVRSLFPGKDTIELKYQAVVIPYDGIGTGLSRMREFAPRYLKWIENDLKDLSNFER